VRRESYDDIQETPLVSAAARLAWAEEEEEPVLAAEPVPLADTELEDLWEDCDSCLLRFRISACNDSTVSECDFS
jgi:hypothetical protein